MRAFGLLFALVAGCADAGILTDSNIEAAKERWDRNEPSSYEMTISRNCFCAMDATGEVIVTVTNGVVVGVSRMSGLEMPAEAIKSWPTVDELFEQIAASRAAGSTVEAEFHALVGYPLRIAIDEDLLPVDGGVVYQISRLRAR